MYGNNSLRGGVVTTCCDAGGEPFAVATSHGYVLSVLHRVIFALFSVWGLGVLALQMERWSPSALCVHACFV